MGTKPEQIEQMREMCKKLEASTEIKSAHPDDWGAYGNFAVHVTPATHDRHTTNRLIALVRRSLPKGAMLRQCFGPDPIRETWGGRTRIVGYSRRFWVFDIDYQHYDATSNRFADTTTASVAGQH